MPHTASQFGPQNSHGAATTGAWAIDACALTKTFPIPTSFFSKFHRRSRDKVLAVDRVSLSIQEGEIHGLVGPNGAGKTTLIKMLTTLLVPTSGHASVAGLDVVKHQHRVRKVVGLVTSNERSFYWRLTGRQNLSFFAAIYHVPRRKAAPWTDELLDLVGLRDKADERFDGYSTGMRQRLALARGLFSKPMILLMDEPTKGVDPIGATEIIKLIRERVTELWRPTILITSHNLGEIERLCDQISLMHHGRIIASGALSELRNLVRASSLHRLTVKNIDGEKISAIAERAEALPPTKVSPLNGAVEVEVSFERGSEGFSRLIRGVIEAGGDVLTSTAIDETIEDVFQKLVPGTAPTTEQNG